MLDRFLTAPWPTPAPRGAFPGLLALAAALVVFWAAEPAGAATVVALLPAPLTDQAGAPLGQVERGQTLPLAGRQGDRLEVLLPAGGRGWLQAGSGAVLAGEPAEHEARLAALAKAKLSRPLADRLLAGRVAEGDCQWYVELAWGRPRRSYMVNLFQDEEHYVYRAGDGRALLLRFKGGRLVPPLPPASLPVETSPAPR